MSQRFSKYQSPQRPLTPRTEQPLRRFLRKLFQIVRDNFRAYLIINAIVYGLVIAGMVAALVFPNLGANQVATQANSGMTDLVRSLLNKPWLFSLTILGLTSSPPMNRGDSSLAGQPTNRTMIAEWG